MIITFSAMKGGVGKTTNAILVTNCLASRGYKVLFVDLDVFNNSGTTYYTTGLPGIDDVVAKKNSFEALSKNTLKDYVIESKIQNVDLLANSVNTSKLRACGYYELQKTLSSGKEDYDYIIVDTSPTYDNIVINALVCADLILTPLQFNSFSVVTAKFLQKQLYDDCPNQAGKWYLLYSWWQEKLANFATSTQSQFVQVMEREFENILDVHIPSTTFASNYTQFDSKDSKLNVDSPKVGSKRLAIEINKLCNMLAGKNSTSDYAKIF